MILKDTNIKMPVTGIGQLIYPKICRTSPIFCTRQVSWFKLEEGLQGNLVKKIFIIWVEITKPLIIPD